MLSPITKILIIHNSGGHHYIKEIEISKFKFQEKILNPLIMYFLNKDTMIVGRLEFEISGGRAGGGGGSRRRDT